MYTHLRFVPRTPWPLKSAVISALRAYGVESLKPAFPGSDHPVRSTVYTIAAGPGVADPGVLQDYIKETDCLIGITRAGLDEIATAPYPERVATRPHSLD